MAEEAADSVRIRLEADDYVAAQRLHTRWTRKRVLVSLAAAAVGLALLAFFHVWPPVAIVGGGLIGGALGGTIAFELTRRFHIPRRARRVFAQQKSLQRTITYGWDASGLSWASEAGSGKTPWSDYLKWRQNERLILLYHSDLIFQLLPKRAFESEQQLAAFLRALSPVPTG